MEQKKNSQQNCPAHHLLPGTVINKKFRIETAVGQGGFGITYIGRDLTLEIPVAIKEYYPTGYVSRNNEVSPEVICNTWQEKENLFVVGKEKFLKEAKALARFSGELGIVSVRDFFEENNTAYIVMEYLEGEDLKAYLQREGRISPEKTWELMFPIMQSLEKVHARGIIHRDISPDNIRLCENGAKLLDFGAARQVSAGLQNSLSVMMKPGYTPYEQYYSDGEQGSWTDVYSLCATMYRCITGVTPMEAPARLLKDQLKTPTALGIPMDSVLEETLMKGLSVKREDRFETIGELICAFQGAGVGAPYEGPTFPNPERPHLGEDNDGTEEKALEDRLVAAEENSSVPVVKAEGKQGIIIWKSVLFLIIVLAAVWLGSKLSRPEENTEKTDAFLMWTPMPSKEAEISPEPSMEPREEAVPTIPLTPAMSGIAVTTYDNKGVSYTSQSWWIDSELNLFIENISEELRKGKGTISVFVPYGALKAGFYALEAGVQKGEIYDGSLYVGGRSVEFQILDGVLRGRGETTCADTGMGYVMDISFEYDFDRTVQAANIVVKLHSTVSSENGKLYINKICFEDEATGTKCVDLTSEEPVISMTRFATKEKVELWEVVTLTEEESFAELTSLTKDKGEECISGIAATPYNNTGAAYGAWWSDSEVNIHVENMQKQLSEGKFYITLYLPYDSLADGTYGIEFSVQKGENYDSDKGGYGCLTEFSIADGRLQAKDHYVYEPLSDGYLVKLDSNYDFAGEIENCNLIIKLHSDFPKGNGPLYINNLYFVDDTAGNCYVDFSEEQLEISAERLSTGEKLETEVIPGNFFWIYW